MVTHGCISTPYCPGRGVLTELIILKKTKGQGANQMASFQDGGGTHSYHGSVDQLLLYKLLSITELEDVMLSSTLNLQFAAKLQVKINFTCITRGSDILEWISDEYIGPGGDRLQILSSSGRTTAISNSNPDTIATRISVDTENGEVVIVSMLSILVSSQYPTATIICSNSDKGIMQNITFQIVTGKLYNYNSGRYNFGHV